jgi:hypothetical protein
MRTLTAALVAIGIVVGIALSATHAGKLGSSAATGVFWTAYIDRRPDMGPTPGPTDPNSPAT